MPYGSTKLLEHSKKMFLKKIEKVVDETVNITAQQITKDLSDTFEKCIDQFYEYETSRYYRHEVGRGTGTGWNLYLANQFRVNYAGGNAHSIHFGWNGNDMMPYKSLNNNGQNVFVSTQHVLDSVMNGIRFNGDGSSYYPSMTWQLTRPITTKYFGALQADTPKQIFNQMLNKMEKVQSKLAGENFKRLYRTMKK